MCAVNRSRQHTQEHTKTQKVFVRSTKPHPRRASVPPFGVLRNSRTTGSITMIIIVISIYSPNKRSFRRPGGVGRGLHSVSQTKIWERELASGASRCLPLPAVASRCLPLPLVAFRCLLLHPVASPLPPVPCLYPYIQHLKPKSALGAGLCCVPLPLVVSRCLPLRPVAFRCHRLPPAASSLAASRCLP